MDFLSEINQVEKDYDFVVSFLNRTIIISFFSDLGISQSCRVLVSCSDIFLDRFFMLTLK